eukprot:g36388.t1
MAVTYQNFESQVFITKEKVSGKLKVDKAPRPDGLHPRVLKEIAKEIVEALVVSFQESLESGRVSEEPLCSYDAAWPAVFIQPCTL